MMMRAHLARHPMDLGAMVADQRLGVGLGQPVSLVAAAEPLRLAKPLLPADIRRSRGQQSRAASSPMLTARERCWRRMCR